MFVLEDVLVRCRVERSELCAWIERDWVRPAQEDGDWRFGEQDVARIELICDLVQNFAIDPDAIDVILPLVDQVYALRRSLRAMTRAVEELPDDSRQRFLDRLAQRLDE